MKGKCRSHFWRGWHDTCESAGEDICDTDYEQWAAWEAHFTNFLGMPPEKHWLFGGRRFRPWFSHRWGPPTRFNPFVAELMSKGGGLLPLYVLHLLSEKPRYGNDIMRMIRERTHGYWFANPGAVYPLLNVMEERGLVQGDWEKPQKRTRRIYRLTEEGTEEYLRLKDVMRPKIEETIEVLNDIYQDLEIIEE